MGHSKELSSGVGEPTNEVKAGMHQEPTYFQKVWSGYWVVKKIVGIGVKQRASQETTRLST